MVMFLLIGKDAASPRYIHTKLSPLARLLFSVNDDPLLTFNFDDGKRIEPEWYLPIIPMVLVNGADGKPRPLDDCKRIKTEWCMPITIK